MIIVKLLISDKMHGDALANSLLKNKFTLNVFGNLFDSYHLSSENTTTHTQVYVIQFVTKSMLFNEIEASLKKEFSQIDFYITATPIVHIAINLHDKIKKRVIGMSLHEDKTEN